VALPEPLAPLEFERELVERVEELERLAHEPVPVLTVEDLERVERKIDGLLELLERYRPLLDQAEARLGRGPRWRGGARGNQAEGN
jgi:hypothetical protein